MVSIPRLAKHHRYFSAVFRKQILGLFCFLIAGINAMAAFATDLDASQVSQSRSIEPGSSIIRQIGFQGAWKLGHLCQVQIEIPEPIRQRVAEVHVTTLDGDGVEVVYRSQAGPTDRTSSRVKVPVRIGRRQSVISATLLDEQGIEIDREDQVLLDDWGLPPTQPLVLALGSAMGLEDLVRTSADGTSTSMTIVELSSAEEMSQWWPDYQAVDLVVISVDSLNSFTGTHSGLEARWQALDQWVRRGGSVVLSLSGSLGEMEEIPFPTQWLPGPIVGEGLIRSPAALESMIITDQPIQPFPALVLLAQSGRTRLNLTDALGRQAPWWVTKSHGFGTIEVIASDLGHSSFAQWKHRRLLWERLVAPYFDKSVLEGLKSGSSVSTDSYLGYQDLTGQLRATLDLFPGVTIVSFSQVAAILIAILVMIGPIDYWVSVRWLKRPHLSWPIAGAILLASVLGLTWYYQSIRPDQVLINTACLVDIDPENGRLDGHLWSHVYSARARRVTVQAEHPRQEVPVYLDWQGLPGSGLGGLQSPMRIERGMPGYAVDFSSSVGSSIDKVGIPAAGTKCFAGVWSESPSDLIVGENRSSLRELSSVDQLEGEIVNPLKVDLRDTMLFYHRWHYPLRSRMPPGDRLVLSADIIPRDISRRLHRQQEIDGKLTTLRWNPAERNELDRLLELMMFHRAATGPNYTSLTHRYQPILDHSNVLESNYAILVGRIESAPVDLQVIPEDASSSTTVSNAVERTWVRILIPVEAGRAGKR
jgi:hypothetical protein